MFGIVFPPIFHFDLVCRVWVENVLGSVGFSQARNTPFQGLAADGAKLALWELLKQGFRCVAFIHDEVVIELPIDADHTAAAEQIEKILCDSMQQLTWPPARRRAGTPMDLHSDRWRAPRRSRLIRPGSSRSALERWGPVGWVAD